MKSIAVDVDGTLFENAFPNLGAPKLDVIAKVKQLKAEGWKLIMWTCREGETLAEAVRVTTVVHGIEWDAINDDLPETKEAYKRGSLLRSEMLINETRCGAKIFANIYLDDRAVNVDDFFI